MNNDSSPILLAFSGGLDTSFCSNLQRCPPRACHILQVPDRLLLEVFTNEGTGTLVVDDIGALSPAEQATKG